MTLKEYAVKRILELEQIVKANESEIRRYRERLEEACKFEDMTYKFAKEYINIIKEHKNDAGSTIPEYITMDAFSRYKNPEIYDFVRNTLKWEEVKDEDPMPF